MGFRELRWCVSLEAILDSKDVILPDTELPASVAASLYPSRINGTTLSLSTSLSLVDMQSWITKRHPTNVTVTTPHLVDMDRWQRMLSTLVTPAAYTAESKDAHATLSDGSVILQIVLQHMHKPAK